jgi:hypothetical protein
MRLLILILITSYLSSVVLKPFVDEWVEDISYRQTQRLHDAQ